MNVVLVGTLFILCSCSGKPFKVFVWADPIKQAPFPALTAQLVTFVCSSPESRHQNVRIVLCVGNTIPTYWASPHTTDLNGRWRSRADLSGTWLPHSIDTESLSSSFLILVGSRIFLAYVFVPRILIVDTTQQCATVNRNRLPCPSHA